MHPLLAKLRSHVASCAAAKEELSGTLTLDWREFDGGLEATRGAQGLRISTSTDDAGRQHVELTIEHTVFGSKKRIPLS